MFYVGKPKSKFPKRFVAAYVVLVLLALAFFAGLSVGAGMIKKSPVNAVVEGGTVVEKEKPPPYLLKDVKFDLLWTVWNIVKDKYLEQPVLDTKLFYGALQGVVASLGDPYSVFLDPDITDKFTDELQGTFEGIGAEIGIKREQLVIIAPLPDTPASRAGLLPQDAILKIDNKDTQGMPLDVAVSNIRGLKGTTVTLKILRQGWKEPRDIPIVRETITIQSVTWKELADGIGYLKVAYFNEQTSARLEQAIQAVLAKNPKGLVLDVRNNPGGLLEVGVRVASEWITPGEAVVIQESRGPVRDVFRSQGKARLKDIPTVVLINQGSASASEIVAGALQDAKVAKLVGERTFGKGSVQTFELLPDGSSVKLTIAHWLTPAGRQIDKVGIAPDFEVKMGKEDYENDQDPQLDKAVELLKL